MKRLVTMRHALEDAELFGHPDIMGGPSWAAWRIVLIAAMGEALTEDERVVFTALTGRNVEPLEPVDELWCVIGRQGGKTRAAAVLAAYFSTMVDYTGKIAPGERKTLPLMAMSTLQAGKAFSYVAGVFNHLLSLQSELLSSTAEVLRLANSVDIEVRPANFRTIRSISAPAAICDEISFWHVQDEGSANPDSEILAALRPALITMGGPLIVISSPHARKGELWDTFERHFGPDGDPRILVVKAPSKVMNPTLPDALIQRAYDRDPARAAAEFGAEFRTEGEAFISREMLAPLVAWGLTEVPPDSNVQYFGFVDPAGGSGQDSMTLAIAHRHEHIAVLDRLVEIKPPFSPNEAAKTFADVLRLYGLNTVVGDKYANEWPRERFREHGITYEVAEFTRSELYGHLLPAINGREILLLDNPKLISQLCGLERRPSAVGRDIIDHARNAHDDLANAMAGAIDLALARTFQTGPVFGVYGNVGDGPMQSRYPPEYLAARGIYHPSDRQRWIKAGVLKADGSPTIVDV